MHITFGLSWFSGEEDKQAIDEGLFRLLDAVSSQGSLKRAAEETRLSYRHAWGFLKSGKLSLVVHWPHFNEDAIMAPA